MLIAYAVAQRRREIGIRLALGAQAREILGLFLRRGLILGDVGLAIGVGGALGRHTVDGIAAVRHQPARSGHVRAVPLVLATAAMLASYLPARRAVSVDAVETLRAE